MENLDFSYGSVPVASAARVFGKDPAWVRAGIISGWLPIGLATRDRNVVTSIEEMDSRFGRINFYISPKKLWEETGFVWRQSKSKRELETFIFQLALQNGYQIEMLLLKEVGNDYNH